jgi:hypothetical protein
VRYCLMVEAAPVSIEDFRNTLAERGTDYILVSQSGSDRAHIRFLGVFENSPVIWDATIRALAHGRPGNACVKTDAQRQYLEIAPHGFPLRGIAVGLNIATIDHAALLKTIIMIRKYKRLHSGRHEFGSAARPNDD